MNLLLVNLTTSWGAEMRNVLILLMMLWAGPALAASGTLAADGTSVISVPGYASNGNMNTLYLSGTFGGGTVTLEGSPDNGTTWIAIPNYSWTAATIANLAFRWSVLRIRIAGSTSPSLNWWVI